MLNACIDDTIDVKAFVLVARVDNEFNYVAHMDSDSLYLCHKIKSAEWFETKDDALNALDALSTHWFIGYHFRIAKYYMLKEVLCLL